MTRSECEGKCTAPPNEGVRQAYWCGFTPKGKEADHEEHDHLTKGQWYHCYG